MNITIWDFTKIFMGLLIQHAIFSLLIPDWYNHQFFPTEILTRSQYMIMILGLGPILFGGWGFFTLYIECPYIYIKKKLRKGSYFQKKLR